MERHALTSAVGGAGRTTLTAALGFAIARLGRPVLMVDLDPANALLLPVTGRPAAGRGLADCLLDDEDWASVAVATDAGVTLLPFGELDATRLAAFEYRLAADPDWLARELARVELGDDAIVLIDTPRRPAPIATAAARCADGLLEILVPSPQAYAALARPPQGRPTRYVLNQFSATQTLHGDLRSLYAEALGSRLAPAVIHRDDTLVDAIAADQPMLDYLAASQAVRDLHALARWLLSPAVAAG